MTIVASARTNVFVTIISSWSLFWMLDLSARFAERKIQLSDTKLFWWWFASDTWEYLLFSLEKISLAYSPTYCPGVLVSQCPIVSISWFPVSWCPRNAWTGRETNKTKQEEIMKPTNRKGTKETHEQKVWLTRLMWLSWPQKFIWRWYQPKNRDHALEWFLETNAQWKISLAVSLQIVF